MGWMDENVMRMMGFPNSPPYPPLLQGRSDKGTAALVRASRLPRPLVSAKNMLDVVTFRKVADVKNCWSVLYTLAGPDQ